MKKAISEFLGTIIITCMLFTNFVLAESGQYSANTKKKTQVFKIDNPSGKRQTTDTVVVTLLSSAPRAIAKNKKQAAKKKNVKTKVRTKWWKIVLMGAAISPVEFFVSTTLHESSHALMAAAFGAKIKSFKPYPHRTENGSLNFGSMSYCCGQTEGQRALVSAAPMFTDTAVLGIYGGMVLGNALPRNRYAQMGIWVFAAGHWVDMVNHAYVRNGQNDTAKIERYLRDEHSFSQTQSILAVRGSQALAIAASGYFLYRGIRRIFQKPPNVYSRESSTLKPYEVGDVYVAPGASSGAIGITFGGSFL